MGSTEVKRLASRSGIPPATLYAYKAGTRNPTQDKVERIADALELDNGQRRDLHAAAGFTLDADLPRLAARIVEALPQQSDRELAVELLRTQARMSRPTISPEVAAIEEDIRAALDAEGTTTRPPGGEGRKGRTRRT